MNLDTVAAFFAKLGFPVAVAAWLLYRVDTLMVKFVENQAMVAVLLQQLLDLHK